MVILKIIIVLTTLINLTVYLIAAFTSVFENQEKAMGISLIITAILMVFSTVCKIL